MIANHGQSVQYVHDEIGVNSRLDTLQAAILDVKLKYLDDFAARRRAVADYYDAAFKGLASVSTPVRAVNSTHVFHQYTLKLNGPDRDAVRKALTDAGVPAMVYYPIPLHMQKAYMNERYNQGAFPVTEQLCKSVISLPIHTEFENEELDFICDTFKRIVGR
jgi:dTDP-4-amino-4,6-dideoxygalactose transaminase